VFWGVALTKGRGGGRGYGDDVDTEVLDEEAGMRRNKLRRDGPFELATTVNLQVLTLLNASFVRRLRSRVRAAANQASMSSSADDP
jgi:hypothetical protein